MYISVLKCQMNFLHIMEWPWINDSIHTYKSINHQKVEIVNDGNRGNGLMAKENFDAYLDSTFEHGGKSYCKYMSMCTYQFKCCKYCGFNDVTNHQNVGFCCLINQSFNQYNKKCYLVLQIIQYNTIKDSFF